MTNGNGCLLLSVNKEFDTGDTIESRKERSEQFGDGTSFVNLPWHGGA